MDTSPTRGFPWRRTVAGGLVLLALVALGLVLAATSCSPRRESSTTPPAGTEGAHAMDDARATLLGARTALEPWARRWARVIPGFTVDSIVAMSLKPALLEGKAGPPANLSEYPHAPQVFGETSPDSSLVVYADFYRDFDREHGEIELHPQPDSWALLTSARGDSLWTLSQCGTPCFFEDAVWLSARRFAFFESAEAVDSLGGAWGTVSLFDLDGHRQVSFRTPKVSAAQYQQYRDLAYDDLRKKYRERLDALKGARGKPLGT